MRPLGTAAVGTSGKGLAGGTVLHVVSSGGLYGIERMLLNLLPELAREHCPVTLLCLDGPNTAVGRAAETVGIPTAYVDCAARVTPHGWTELWRVVGSLRPRLMHVHGYKATVLAGAVALGRRIPLIATYHSMAANAASQSRSLAWYLALETQFVRRARTVAAVSSPIADELQSRGVSAERIRVIPNGISIHASHDYNGGLPFAHDFNPSLLSLSRLAPEKKVDRIIDAVGVLRGEFPRLGLVVAGDGPLRLELEEHARSSGLADAVRFIGFVEDVGVLFAQATAFVLASETEGMPIAVLEAMARGVPIVASDVGGIPSMVQPERDALLIDPTDSESLVRALRRLLADAALGRQLSEAARNRFGREFSANLMAQSYIQLYDDVAPRS